MDLYLFNKVVEKYLAGTATENEQKLVEAYWERFSVQNEIILSEEEKEIIRLKIHEGVRKEIRRTPDEGEIHEPPKVYETSGDRVLVVPIFRRTYFKRIAAAAVILIIAGVGYFSIYRSGGLTSETETIGFTNDIAPANQGATLTLADGRIIPLDSTNNGSLLNEDGINIIKKDGEVVYTVNNSGSEIIYNTLSTAKGRNYHLKLSDGTTVWLDAMSSIKYPAAFTGKDRVVEITGQAYFDVAKKTNKPFVVLSGLSLAGGSGRANSELRRSQDRREDEGGPEFKIEVLGTEFNVNTYSLPTTTLISGSVKLSAAKKSIILNPLEQSVLKNEFTVNKNINIENITAWKNNKFYFDGSTIEEIMTEISRWYDIDVEYRSKISEEFVAKISRDVPLSRLLTLLEMTNQVKFNIEGKKITVIKP